MEIIYRAWTNRQSFSCIHFDHSPQKVLAVRRDKVRHMEHSQLHLLQQIPQVVVIERQSTLTHTHIHTILKDEKKTVYTLTNCITHITHKENM